MPDETYTTKVYKPDGDTIVVAAGGKIVVEDGGLIEGPAGQAAAIADADDDVTGLANNADVTTPVATKDEHDALAGTVNEVLAALRAAGIVAPNE